MLAIAYNLSDRNNASHAAMDQARKLNPNLSTAFFRSVNATLHPAYLEKRIEPARQAELPENDSLNVSCWAKPEMSVVKCHDCSSLNSGHHRSLNIQLINNHLRFQMAVMVFDDLNKCAHKNIAANYNGYDNIRENREFEQRNTY